MSKNNNTQKIVGLGLFTAIVIVLQLMGSFIRFGTFSISLVLVPVVIGAALYGAGVGACVGSGVGSGVAVCAGSAVAAASIGCAVSSVAGEISTSAAGSAARVSSAVAAHPDSANTMPNATIDFFIKTTPFILGVVAYTIGLSAFNHKIYRSSCPRCRLSV